LRNFQTQKSALVISLHVRTLILRFGSFSRTHVR
jgi:hypothetical protein